MKTFLSLLWLTSVFSQSTLAQTQETLSYRPIETCNNGSIVFSEAYLSGRALTPEQGIITVATSANAGTQVSTSAILITGDYAHGFEFGTKPYGNITLDANGVGDLPEEICTATPATSASPVTVSCTHSIIPLNCKHIFPPPTGFSGGN
jgi:hypothetical protein